MSTCSRPTNIRFIQHPGLIPFVIKPVAVPNHWFLLEKIKKQDSQSSISVSSRMEWGNSDEIDVWQLEKMIYLLDLSQFAEFFILVSLLLSTSRWLPKPTNVSNLGCFFQIFFPPVAKLESFQSITSCLDRSGGEILGTSSHEEFSALFFISRCCSEHCFAIQHHIQFRWNSHPFFHKSRAGT